MASLTHETTTQGSLPLAGLKNSLLKQVGQALKSASSSTDYSVPTKTHSCDLDAEVNEVPLGVVRSNARNMSNSSRAI